MEDLGEPIGEDEIPLGDLMKQCPYNLPKVDLNYMPDEDGVDYEELPYRKLQKWYTLDSAGNVCHLKDLVVYAGLRIGGMLQVSNSHDGEYAEVHVQFEPQQFAVDRTACYRGYWANTEDAYYWLQEPLLGVDDHHYLSCFRAPLACLSQLYDFVFTNDNDPSIPSGYAQKTILQVHKETNGAFDRQLLAQFKRLIKRHVVDFQPYLTDQCKFVKNFATLRNKEELTMEQVLALTRRAEASTRTHPWGESTVKDDDKLSEDESTTPEQTTQQSMTTTITTTITTTTTTEKPKKLPKKPKKSTETESKAPKKEKRGKNKAADDDAKMGETVAIPKKKTTTVKIAEKTPSIPKKKKTGMNKNAEKMGETASIPKKKTAANKDTEKKYETKLIPKKKTGASKDDEKKGVTKPIPKKKTGVHSMDDESQGSRPKKKSKNGEEPRPKEKKTLAEKLPKVNADGVGTKLGKKRRLGMKDALADSSDSEDEDELLMRALQRKEKRKKQRRRSLLSAVDAFEESNQEPENETSEKQQPTQMTIPRKRPSLSNSATSFSIPRKSHDVQSQSPNSIIQQDTSSRLGSDKNAYNAIIMQEQLARLSEFLLPTPRATYNSWSSCKSEEFKLKSTSAVEKAFAIASEAETPTLELCLLLVESIIQATKMRPAIFSKFVDKESGGDDRARLVFGDWFTASFRIIKNEITSHDSLTKDSLTKLKSTTAFFYVCSVVELLKAWPDNERCKTSLCDSLYDVHVSTCLAQAHVIASSMNDEQHLLALYEAAAVRIRKINNKDDESDSAIEDAPRAVANTSNGNAPTSSTGAPKSSEKSTPSSSFSNKPSTSSDHPTNNVSSSYTRPVRPAWFGLGPFKPGVASKATPSPRHGYLPRWPIDKTFKFVPGQWPDKSDPVTPSNQDAKAAEHNGRGNSATTSNIGKYTDSSTKSATESDKAPEKPDVGNAKKPIPPVPRKKEAVIRPQASGDNVIPRKSKDAKPVTAMSLINKWTTKKK